MSVFVKETDSQSNEITHLIQPGNGDEFTYCCRPISDESDGGFNGILCSGPANCKDCHAAVNAHKKRFKNVLWSRAMKTATF